MVGFRLDGDVVEVRFLLLMIGVLNCLEEVVLDVFDVGEVGLFNIIMCDLILEFFYEWVIVFLIVGREFVVLLKFFVGEVFLYVVYLFLLLWCEKEEVEEEGKSGGGNGGGGLVFFVGGFWRINEFEVVWFVFVVGVEVKCEFKFEFEVFLNNFEVLLVKWWKDLNLGECFVGGGMLL